MKNGMRPIHPGEVLREEWQHEGELRVSVAMRLSEKTGLDVSVLLAFFNESYDLTPADAERLAKLGTTAEFWLNLQADYKSKEGA